MTLPLIGAPDWQDPLHAATLQTDVQSQNVNGGGQFVSAVYDMRAYQTASIMFAAVSNVIPKTQFGHVDVQVQWWANAAGSQIIYEDRYPFFPQGAGGAFATDLGRIMLRTPVLGPYMSIQFSNNGVDQVGFSWRVIGNTKGSDRRQLINTDVNGHTTFNRDAGALIGTAVAVLAGATFTTTVPMYQGMASQRIANIGGACNMVFLAPDGANVQAWQLVAGQTIHETFALPRMQVLAQIVNVSGANITGVWELTSAGQVW